MLFHLSGLGAPVDMINMWKMRKLDRVRGVPEWREMRSSTGWLDV